MTRRQFLSSAARQDFFGIPSDIEFLEQYYILGGDDRALIQRRRRPENKFGLAIHIALLRYPGQGWFPEDDIPDELKSWLAEQIDVPLSALTVYGNREATRATHRVLAIKHLGLRPFTPSDLELVLDIATKASFGTDDGRQVMGILLNGMREEKLVFPSIDTLERIGLTGRARARKVAAQRLNDALNENQITALEEMLEPISELGVSRLAWLRGMPHSTSVASLHAIIERLNFVRSLKLPTDLGHDIHPARLTKFAREGAVAPAHLLSDFGQRRRIATLAAQLMEMNIVLTDSAILIFERLTGRLFTRSKRNQDKALQTKQAKLGHLVRLFGDTLQAISQAKESGENVFETLEQMVGWERLMAALPEIETLGILATEDSLTLASKHYTQLRKFAPAFLDAFLFDLPQAGADLQAALTLIKDHNQRDKRKLPDVVPMPFPAKQWKALILENGKPQRRIYETAVIATLRDRLRAGDAWVEGSRDYRRFDTYLVPKKEAYQIMGDVGLPEDGRVWLDERRDLLDQRMSDIQYKLKHDQLEGVRLESGKLIITPHEPVTPPESEQLDRAIDAVMPRIRITELLWDVVQDTHFLEAFTDLGCLTK